MYPIKFISFINFFFFIFLFSLPSFLGVTNYEDYYTRMAYS